MPLANVVWYKVHMLVPVFIPVFVVPLRTTVGTGKVLVPAPAITVGASPDAIGHCKSLSTRLSL